MCIVFLVQISFCSLQYTKSFEIRAKLRNPLEIRVKSKDLQRIGIHRIESAVATKTSFQSSFSAFPGQLKIRNPSVAFD